MAIEKNNYSTGGKTVISYPSAVIKTWDRYWLDGMLSEYADCWDNEQQKIVTIEIGYYGDDCRNMYGNTFAKVDLSRETARQIMRYLKKEAIKAYTDSVIREKAVIKKGRTAQVIKGRKVPKGTMLHIFWTGKRETFRSRQYNWMHETEEVAGGYTETGEKVWIKTEYLKNLTKVSSPTAKERKRWIQSWITKRAREIGFDPVIAR